MPARCAEPAAHRKHKLAMIQWRLSMFVSSVPARKAPLSGYVPKALKLGRTATGVGVFCGKELAKLAESYEVVRYNFFVLNPNTQIIFQKCYQADQGQRVKL